MPVYEKTLAVVTGGSRGIGAAIARRLAANGTHVVLVGRDQEKLRSVREEIVAAGGSAAPLTCDLQDATSVTALGEDVRKQYGRCDLLINCAGIGRMGKPLYETAIEDFDAILATNLRGTFLMIRAIAPLMISQGSGHIVNISSLAGKNPLPNGAAYAASKWGLHGLTYSVAEELRDHGIRVSVVAPGSVATEFSRSGSGKSPDKKLRAEDVAHVVAMLANESSQSFVSEVLVRPLRK
jgi:NAD(P)-dependent dehydrogenase (short-subunit alcohol dehydrogenase family)